MANFLCSTKCGALAAPPKSFEINCQKPGRKKYGFPYLGFLDRSLVISDPTNIEEWCAAAEKALVCISPCGKIEMSASTTTTSDTNNCGVEEVIETVYDLTFSTYSADSTGLSHCQYYESLLSNGCLNAILFDCDGNPMLTAEYRDFINGVTATPPTGSPGFEFTMTSIPTPTSGDGNFEVWSFGIQFKLDGTQMLCPVILDGLQECLVDQLATAEI